MEEIQTQYKPKKQEQDRLTEIYNDMRDTWEIRHRGFNYFDDADLNEYINESVKRWNSYLPPRGAEDWRTAVFMPETRNKIIAIASFIASQRMRVELTARSKNSKSDKKLASLLKSLYDYSMDSDNGDQKFLLTTMEALIKGTAIIFEGYDYRIREVKKVTDINWETGEKKFTKEEIIDADNCTWDIIPLEDVFIPDFYEADIQKQPYIIIRELVSYTTAQSRYNKYPLFKHVKTREHFSTDEKEGNIFFYENWNGRTNEEDQVEILHYYRKSEDRHDIVANGVLLTDMDNPIIFDHKDYPFSKTVFEPMGVDFFYGKGLTQKIASEQDVLNTMYNMMLDRTYLSIMPFFFTSLMDEIEVDDIGPFQRVQVSDPSKIREANIASIQGGDIQMMEKIQESMNKSSVDPAQQGQVSGDTATAVLQARESSIQIMGLFMNFLGWMMYNQATQRLANILQFFPKPNRLKNSEGKFAIKENVMEDQMLSDGTTGIRIVRLVDDMKKVPNDIQREDEAIAEAEKAEEAVEITYVTPQMLRDIDFKIKVVPASSIPETKSLRKAMALEYANTAFQFFPDMVNKPKVLEMINEVFDINSDEMNKSEEEMEQEKQVAMEEMAMQEGQQPGGPGQGQNSELVQQMAQTKKPSTKQLLEMPK